MKDRGGGYLAIGVVLRPHGIGGKFRMRFLGDEPRLMHALDEVRIGHRREALAPHRILRIQAQGSQFILKLEDFTLEDAKAAVGAFVWVRRDQLPPLEPGEYYWEDLIGMTVVAERGGRLGVVRGVLDTGGHHVLRCQAAEEEFLLPFVEDVILGVDLSGGEIRVRPMDGLIPDFLLRSADAGNAG